MNIVSQHTLRPQIQSSYKLWSQWVVATTIGELVGFAVPITTGIVAWKIGLPDIAIAIIVTLVGSFEGAALGYAQWLVLRQYLPQVARRDWMRATALAAVVGYAIGVLPSTIGSNLAQINLAILIVAGGVLGIIFLVSIGFAQWLVLRQVVQHAGQWIVANAIAWPLGVAVPFIGMALVPDGAPTAVWIATGIVSGILMGVVVGAVTGSVLVWILRRQH
jgi:hypothetical protein